MAERRRKRSLPQRLRTGVQEGKENTGRSRLVAALSRHSNSFFLLGAVVVTFFLYRHAIPGKFLYDDIPQVQTNPALLSWAGVFHYFRVAVPFSGGYLATGGAFYRPLFWISLAIDRRLWGLNPLPFHVTNVALHCVNGFLWFVLLKRLGWSRWWAALVALAWLSLPIHSEAVAWISSRHILLCTSAILISLVLTDWFLRSRKPAALALLFLAELMAMLSYEAGVLVVPATLLWAWFQTGRPQKTWFAIGLAGSAPAVIWLLLRHSAHSALPGGSFTLLRGGLTFFRYLEWMALPVHMSIERSTDLPANQLSMEAIAAWAALLILVGCAVYWRDKVDGFSFGVFWLSLMLLPFCGIVPNYQGMAERYEYLSSMGLVILVGALIRMARRPARPFAVAAAAAWLSWGAWRLNARSLDWKDELTIDRASLAATPNSAVLLYNIAIAENDSGDVAGALADYGRAIAANPLYEPAFLNLAALLRRQGDFQEALGVLHRAIALNANDADAWTAIGNVYQQMRSFDAARQAYAKAAALNPTDARAASNLGAALQQLGDLSGAGRQYERAIALNPNEGAAYCNLSMVFFQQGKMNDAIGILKRAIARDTRYAAAYFDLGVLYEQTGQRDLAISMYRKALKADPAYPNAELRLRSLQR